MKNIFIMMAAVAITMCACSDDNENGNEIINGNTEKKDSLENPIKNGEVYLFADNDTVNTWLGAGYDVTDAYLKGKREQIINLGALGDERMFNLAYPTYNNINVIGYGSAEDLLKGLTDQCEIEVPEKSAMLFTGTILDCPFIETASDYSNKFHFIFTTFHWESANIMRINLEKNHLNKYDNYLTDEFKKAIETESADKVVERFGTHLLTDVVIGRCITTLYSSRSTDSKILYEGMYNRFSATVSGNNKYEVDTNNPDGRLLVWLNGGNMERLPLDWKDGKVRMKGSSKAQIIFNDWILNTTNGALIRFNGKRMIPIYELVNDENKCRELREAVSKRILSRQLE